MPFTNKPWQSPESKLDANDFCKCSLIDENEPGTDKVKAKCHLPVRATPGAPYSRGAIRAAMGGHGIFRLKGVSGESKRKAARRLVRLAGEAGIRISSRALLRLAGKKAK